MVNNENIFVDFDYQNIIVVDPNKVVDEQGNVKERFIKQENLVMFANLECVLPPRTKLSVGNSALDGIESVNIASINFLKPQIGDKLANTYTDEITGKGSLERDSDGNFLGVNQNVQTTLRRPDKPGEFYDFKQQRSNGEIGTVDNGMLGITSISVQYGTDYTPVITMSLEDIKGRALFEAGNNSPYRAFFSYPYPLFTLTLKGYYGKAIKYPLMLIDFKTKIDSESGNFSIDLKFMSYKYTMTSQISMQTIQNVPHMYRTTIDVNSNQNPTTKTNEVTKIELTKGYQKILEVYNDYKSKGLIPDDFPPLTLVQLQRKLDSFVSNTLANFKKQDLTAFTNAQTYRNLLTELNNKIRSTTNTESWFSQYIDQKNYFVLNNGLTVYELKGKTAAVAGITPIVVNESVVKAELQSICNEFSKSNSASNLNKVPVFGAEEKNDKYRTSRFNLKLEDFLYPVSESMIDYQKTYQNQTGNQPLNEKGEQTAAFLEYKAKTQTYFQLISNITEFEDNQFTPIQLQLYFFDGKIDNSRLSFNSKLEEQSKDFEIKFEKYQKDKSDELIKILEEPQRGIGFRPTIRNVLSVFYASGEAYLRLLDDVHRRAWDQRSNPIRFNAINTTIQGGDQPLNSTTGDEKLVYPWPQISVLTTNEKETRYDIRYPGDKDLAQQFQAYDYSIWPEVEFVEEYISSGVLRNSVPTSPEIFENGLTQSQFTSVNALEYPIDNDVYFNKEQVKFLFEIWERLYLISNYTNLNKGNSDSKQIYDLVATIESNNILKSLGNSNPFLIKALKEYGINSSNFEAVLRHISNEGQGESWQTHIRGYYNTPYIRNITTNTFSLKPFRAEELYRLLSDFPNIDTFSSYILDSSTNVTTDLDVFPFTDKNWCKLNLANAGSINDLSSVNSTSKVIKVNQSSKIISNFENDDSNLVKRPISNFNYIKVDQPLLNLISPITNINLKNLYETRSFSFSKQNPTEGTIRYNNYDGLTTKNQTTSIFNTPYFINSIQEGIDKFRNSNPYPFTSAAYLFLNSLPLATLREKFKTYQSVDTNLENVTDLDYMFATFKKFNAIHKLPYAWILRYGSIWYRYKQFNKTGNDILSNVWNNFDQVNNFDPITQSGQKIYYLTINGIQRPIYLQGDVVLGNNVQTNINLGFYPKLINDFSVFFKGTPLFDNYSDATIQSTIDNQFFISDNFPNSNFVGQAGVDENNPNRTINITSWSSILKVDSTLGFTLPSVGSTFNQFYVENFSYEIPTQPTMVNEVNNNNTMYDGSVRLAWSSPNYGYFDNSKLSIPPPTKYMKKIIPNTNSGQENFSINGDGDYTDISEIFSVFNHDILDSFETEFLKFSQSIYDTPITGITEDTTSAVNDSVFTNFQYLMRNIFKITPPLNLNSNTELEITSNLVLNNMYNLIDKFLSFDYLLKYGNPNNFDQRIFRTFAGIGISIVDPYKYNAYTTNSPFALPTVNSQFPIQNVQTQYPNAWRALQEYVGFSDIVGLKYADSGSTIFDFFIDNNVEFSEENVKNLYQLIRIYATQKLKDNTYNSSKFTNTLNDLLNNNTEFQNNIFNSLMQKLTKQLPNINETPTRDIQSNLNGDVTKVSLWEQFKELNDKWIAGTNISFKTIFEDIIYLDRGGKDVGDEVFVDIFRLNQGLKNLNPQTNLFNKTKELVKEAGFNEPMAYPSFVNFYGVQSSTKNAVPNIPNSYEFANNLFGTHMNVDLSESSPKLVCMLPNVPSAHPESGDIVSNFKNDSFNMKRVNQNPLIQNLSNKNDWDKSNRLVGFTVDFGTINQGIFSKISIAQESGKPTKQVLESYSQLASLGESRAGSTQYLSMYDIYKNTSYKCEITMLGNVLIQPMMYFNLEHVPMFNGPYMITNISHSISPGSFVTQFAGVRQSVLSYAVITDPLQTIRQNFVDYFKQNFKQESPQTSQETNNSNLSEEALKTNNSVTSVSPSKSPSCTASTAYSNFVIIDAPSKTVISPVKLIQYIKTKYPSNQNILYVIMAILGQQSYKEPNFESYENNYAGLRLDLKNQNNEEVIYTNKDQMKQNYFCVTTSTTPPQQFPLATFFGYEDCVDFVGQRIIDRLPILEPLTNVTSTDDANLNSNAEKLSKFITDYWPIKIDGTYSRLTDKETIKNKTKKMIQLVNSNQ